MIPLIVLLAIILSSLYFVFCLYLRWNFNYWNQRKVTGPKPQTLKGTFPKTSAGECNLVEELHEIYLKYKETHSCVGLFLARSPKLFITDPKLVEQILVTNFKNFRDNESSQWTSPLVEQLRIASPFVSVGEAWKERRLQLSQTMTVNRLRACHDLMTKSAIQMSEFIKAQSPDTDWDIKELAGRFTSNVMAKFIWGIEENTFESLEKRSTIHQMADTMLEQSLRCVRYYGRTAAWPWLRKLRPVRFFAAESDRFFQQLAIDTLKQRLELRGTHHNDVLNCLMQLREKKSLSDIQLAGHTTTVLIDGFETASILLAHCLLLLAENPRVQSKLRLILQDIGGEPSYDDLMAVEYLDQCIQETLRLFPPLTTLFKLCTEPTMVDNFMNGSKVSLYPGDVIYISTYSFHHDPAYYEQPEHYWPERFDQELGGIKKYKDMGVYLPFGDGPRMCPGIKLGMTEVKIALAELIKSFEFSPALQKRKSNKLTVDSMLLRVDYPLELKIKAL